MRAFVKLHSALADENRLRLLNLIRGGEVCVCQLQEVLQTNQPRISRHLAYLRKSGLVEFRRVGRWSHYRLKKLGARHGKIVIETLICLQEEPQMKKDLRRLKKVVCAPVGKGSASSRRP